jgi:hypothetical protein
VLYALVVAVAALNEALRSRSSGMTYLKVEPLMDSLHSDARHKLLVKQLQRSQLTR